MSQINKSLRIRTDIGTDAYISVNLDQNYETLEILSLKVDQKGSYRYHVSDYGVVVGRVLANNGFGVPNARLSLFIEKNDTTDIIKEMLYPYEDTVSKNSEGIRYNLLPDRQKDDCHQVVGTFPNKRVVLDDTSMLEIFDEYYKYTTRTNDAGDYMFFGIPTGSYTLHMDLDISDCGKLSQRPRDFIYKGYTIEQFENPNQFKIDTELSSLAQIFTQDTTVDVKPFWGDANEGSLIGITRKDIDVAFKFEPTCVFMGSIVTDNSNEGISTKCVPTNKMGDMASLTTGPGTIEIIRKKIDNTIEELSIKGTQLINGNGVWCFQIPMNLDYVMTDEFGNTVPTDNPEKGIPTRCEVRFRISLDEPNADVVRYHRGKVLVPHNPQTENDLDYNFGSKTKDNSFKSLMWNNVYTIKSFIPRFQKARNIKTDKFTGIKKINAHESNNPMPYNNIRIKIPFMFWLICNIIKLFIRSVNATNKMKRMIMNVVGNLADITLTYSYISDELCPDLENWYFAPGIVTSPVKKKSNKTCRQWENQSVCETFKEIASDVAPSTKPNDFFKINIKNRVPGTEVIVYKSIDFDPNQSVTLVEYITEEELKNLTKEGGFRYYTYYSGKTNNGVLDEDGNPIYEEVMVTGSTSYTQISNYYTKATTDEVKKYASPDNTSNEVQNALDNDEVRINLTNNTNYLMQCIEINLAQEYGVIKFDFYNDWINGCVYLPRWARDVKYKKKRKNGQKIITERVKGCINDIKKSRISRRYVQQCSLKYDNGEIKTEVGCHSKKLRCHQKNGMTYISVFGGKSGVVNETKTSLGQNVYYLKPYEWKNTTRIPFFATDIVMLGTLLDCNEYGIPSTFDSLLSTSYKMPPQLALTNVDDDSEQYFDLSSQSPTPLEIQKWQCNSKCNKGGKMVIGNINTGGVTKKTPSYSDLDAIIAEYDKMGEERVKKYKVDDKVYESSLVYSDSENTNKALSLRYDVSADNYDEKEDCNVYYFSDETINIGKDTKVITFYEVTKNNFAEPPVLEYEDIFPVTEMSGIDWSYQGEGYNKVDSDDKLWAPGGHFFGLSCGNAQTNIRSCVNLQRACEIGVELSTRFEVPMGFNDSNNENDLSFDVVNYLYVAPNGLIGKDQVTDVSFRSAFATMNQNSLRTRENEYGYKVYDFKYLLPDSFDGAIEKRLSGFTAQHQADEAKYWGDYINELTGQTQSSGITNELTIEKGYTITRLRNEGSDDYVNFRFGGSPTYLLSGGYMPVYQNSFYFYFGLKDGSTALDEFKTQFYAPCAKNIIVEERGSMTLTTNPISAGEFLFDIDINVRGLEAPFTYSLKSDISNGYREKSGGVWKGINYNVDGEAFSNNIELKNVPVGTYNIIIQDVRGNEIQKTVGVGLEEYKINCDLLNVTHYTANVKDTSLSDIIGESGPFNKSNGGYISGDFSFFDTDIDDTIVVRRNYNGKLEDVDKKTYWDTFYDNETKRFYVWGPGAYEIWVRNQNSTYEFKYGEVNILNGVSVEFSLISNLGDGITSEELFELNRVSKWWGMRPFGDGEGDLRDEKYGYKDKFLFPLYRAIVDYREKTANQSQFMLQFNTKYTLCKMDTSNEEIKPIDNNILDVNPNTNKPTFVYLGLSNEGTWSLSCEGTIENGVFKPISTDTYNYEKILEYVKVNQDSYFVWGENMVVTVKEVNGNLNIEYDGETIENSGQNTLGFFLKLPVFRKAFKFKYYYCIYKGNTISGNTKEALNDAVCYNNNITTDCEINTNSAYFYFTEKQADGYDNDNYNNRLIKFETKEGESFCTGGTFAEGNNNYFVVTPSQMKDKECLTIKHFYVDSLDLKEIETKFNSTDSSTYDEENVMLGDDYNPDTSIIVECMKYKKNPEWANKSGVNLNIEEVLLINVLY